MARSEVQPDPILVGSNFRGSADCELGSDRSHGSFGLSLPVLQTFKACLERKVNASREGDERGVSERMFWSFHEPAITQEVVDHWVVTS